MEEIKELFHSLQDCAKDIRKLAEVNQNISRVESEMKSLEDILKDIQHKKQRLDHINKNIAEITHNNKIYELAQSKITKVADITPDLLSLNDNILFELCKNFLTDLVCEWKDDTDHTIYISKSIPALYKILKQKSFYSALKRVFYTKLQSLFAGFYPENFVFEDSSENLIIHINKELGNRDNYEMAARRNKELSNFTLQALKSNFLSLIKDRIQLKDSEFAKIYKTNIQIFDKTKFSSNDVEEDLNRILVSTFIEICEKDTMSDEISDIARSLSKDYECLLFIQKNLPGKNQVYLSNTIISYFNLEKCENSLIRFFLMLNDISDAHKSFSLDQEFVNNLKEKIFYHIIQFSGAKEIISIPQDNIIGLHEEIVQRIGSFEEILKFFIKTDLRLIFMTTFLNELSKTVLSYIFSLTKLEENGVHELLDSLNHIVNKSDEPEQLVFYCKINCIQRLLTTSEEDISVLKTSPDFCLTSNEFSKLIHARFG